MSFGVLEDPMTMNLRPSNLEQGPRPIAMSRDAVVSEQDSYPAVPAAQGRIRRAPRLNKMMVLAFVLAGGLTAFWGGLLLWLIYKAFYVAVG
jgi:hypothetical protein